MAKIRIVKFGGACLTDKQNEETLNEEGIDWCVNAVNSMLADSPDPIIIVSGAGSFGHHLAKKYQLTLGERTLNYGEINQDRIKSRRQEIALGMAQTKSALLTLQQHFIKKLVSAGIPAISVSPSSLISLYNPTEEFLDNIEDKETHEANLKEDRVLQETSFSNQIKRFVNRGLVPVLHGDVVIDIGQRSNVLSGDTIIEMLCKAYSNEDEKVPVAFFVTNVYGAYLKCPTEQDEVEAKGLIREFKLIKTEQDEQRQQNNHSLIMNMFHPQEQEEVKNNSRMVTPEFALVDNKDVTGGFEAKLKSAMSIVKANKDVDIFIVKCGTEDALKVLSEGTLADGVKGTHVHCKLK
ncbi:isopentenyl phosphate kinase [Acrasis kona]|uniref:Isopentenyl phosphate kinase n=1 Tax=Acrasis kona TaxID=1008807 RepID=A0AAW2ZF54_9EUKA